MYNKNQTNRPNWQRNLADGLKGQYRKFFFLSLQLTIKVDLDVYFFSSGKNLWTFPTDITRCDLTLLVILGCQKGAYIISPMARQRGRGARPFRFFRWPISCGSRCWILPKSATLRRMPHSEIEVHCMKLTACKMALRKLTLKEFALLWFFSSKLTLVRPKRGYHRAHFYHKIFQCQNKCRMLIFLFWILYRKSKSKWSRFFFFYPPSSIFLIYFYVATY